MLVRLLDVDFEDRLFLMRFHGHIGFVYSNAEHELYWQIDEHGDPHQVELATIPSGEVCEVLFSGLINLEGTELNSELCCERLLDLSDSLEWFTPNWLVMDTEDFDDDD